MRFKPDNMIRHGHLTTPNNTAYTMRFQFRRNDMMLCVVFRVKFPCTRTYPVPGFTIHFLGVVPPFNAGAPFTMSRAAITLNPGIADVVTSRQLSRTGEVI